MTAIMRILWKEARTQSQIWLALLLATALLQLVALVMLKLNTQRGQPIYDVQSPLSLIMTLGFAVTSVALLFSAETEERTSLWLRQLPVSTGRLAIGKIGFGLVAIALFIVASIVITGGWSALFKVPRQVHADYWSPGVLTVSAISLVVSILCTLAFSLTLKSVLTTVMMGAISSLVVLACMVPLVIRELPASNESLEASLFPASVVILVLAVVDLALLVKWARATPATVLVGRRASLELNEGGVWFPQILASLAATSGGIKWRSGLMLWWGELRRAIPWCFFVGVVWSVVEISLQAQPLDGLREFVPLVLICLITGAFSFLKDKTSQPIEFLSHRGITAGRLWRIRTLIWGGGLLITLCLLGVIRLPGIVPTTGGGLSQALNTLVGSLSGGSSGQAISTGRYNSLVIAMACGLFTVGQLAFCSIQRVVLAFAGSIIAGTHLAAWSLNWARWDVDPVWSTWPLIIGMQLAIVWPGQAWMDRLWTWTRRIKQLVPLTVGGLLAVALSLSARWTQVPETSALAEAAAVEARMAAFDSGFSNEWKTRRANDYSLLSLANRLTDQTALDPSLLNSENQGLGTYSLREACRRVVGEVTPDSSGRFPFETSHETYQLQQFQAAMKLIRFHAGQACSIETLADCLATEIDVLANVRYWTASKQRTPEALDECQKWLESLIEEQKSIRIEDMQMEALVRDHVLQQALLTQSGPVAARLKSDQQAEAGPVRKLLDETVGAMERRRASRLLNDLTRAMMQSVNAYSVQQQGRSGTDQLLSQDLLQLKATTPLLNDLKTNLVQQQALKSIGVDREIRLALEATWLVTVLQAERQRTGAFPKRLSPEIRERMARLSGMSGGAFRYEPVRIRGREQLTRYFRNNDQPMICLAGMYSLTDFEPDASWKADPDRIMVLFGNQLDRWNVNWPKDEPVELPPAVPDESMRGMGMGAEMSGGMGPEEMSPADLQRRPPANPFGAPENGFGERPPVLRPGREPMESGTSMLPSLPPAPDLSGDKVQIRILPIVIPVPIPVFILPTAPAEGVKPAAPAAEGTPEPTPAVEGKTDPAPSNASGERSPEDGPPPPPLAEPDNEGEI